MKKDNNITKPTLKKSDCNVLSQKMPYITAMETNHFYKNYLDWVYHNQPNDEIESRIKKDKEIMRQAFESAEVYELLVPDKLNPSEVSKIIGL